MLQSRRTLRNVLFAIALAAVVLLAGWAGFEMWKFPFHRDAVVERVKNQTGARVEIGAFHEKWFPPGFSAERVRISDPAGDVLTIDAVEMEDLAGLNADARGLRLVLPHETNGKRRTLLQPETSGSTTPSFDKIRLDNATLDIETDASGMPPLEFAVHTLLLSNAGPHRRTRFQVSLNNPKPRGEIRAHGEFGPVDMEHTGQTPISGAFTFEHADLTVDSAVSGLLNARGEFRGSMSSLDCTGTADVPRFQVAGSSHPVHIAARFAASGNALNGDAELKSVVAHYNSTTVSAAGSVAGEPDRKGKTVTLNMGVRAGRVEDLLVLFTRHSQPAMRGPITLQAKFIIPPGPPGFLTKLKADGEFAIAQAQFTNPRAQTPVDRLSASAEGESKEHQRENPTLAPVAARGKVTARNGIARLPDVAFEVPGVSGRLAGTFGLRDRAVDMRGTLDTAGKLADTTSGIKSLLLKAAGPLWRNKGSAKIIPFGITGTASHPVFSLRLRE